LESHIDYQYWFPSNGEPTKTTATYHTQQDFMKAYMEGKEPMMIATYLPIVLGSFVFFFNSRAGSI